MPATMPALDVADLLKNIPAGAWVAISADETRVIAFGAELRTVLEQAKERGEAGPLITRVPETTAALIL